MMEAEDPTDTRRLEADITREALMKDLLGDASRPRPRWGGGHSGESRLGDQTNDILAKEFGTEGLLA